MVLRVKEIIKREGFSMQEVADKLGVTRDTLTRNINGNPTIETLQKIAAVIGVYVTDLFVPGCNNELTALIEHKGQFYKAETIEELEKIVNTIKGNI